MKAVIIYSGKGGVGKTTTTANIARVLALSGKKVLIIDADINTPSMSTEFNGEHPHENIWVHSTGNMFPQFIYLENAMVRKYLSNGLKTMREVNPDYILVDTPPSVTNIHLELIKKLKVSHIVFVSQPTVLSREDVPRTASFFIEKCGGIDVSMVENMAHDEKPGDYGIDVVAQIPYQDRHDTNNLHIKERKKYESIIARINESVDVVQSDSFLNSGIREDFDIISIFHNKQGKSNTYKATIQIDGTNKLETIIMEDLKFLSCRTWDKVVAYFIGMETFDTRYEYDHFLQECTSDRIKRLLEAFKEDESAYFMVTKSPGISNIKLMPGEIGLASLDITSKSYYSVPRLKYQTSRGSVTLFPYEVKPVDMEEIQLCIQDGYSILTDGRYLPPKEIIQDLQRVYGKDIGLTNNWEEQYNSWIQ